MTSANNPPPLVPAFPTMPAEAGQQLAAARLASKKIRRAVTVATFDAWTVAIFAGLSLLCGLSGGFSGILLAVAMGGIAYVEFKNVGRLRRLDAVAAKTLGYNQLAFAASLIIYALWSLHSNSLMADFQSHASEFGESAQEIENLGQTISQVLYGSLIVIAIFAQGGSALYYFSREKIVKQYVAGTPDWILEMQRAGGPL